MSGRGCEGERRGLRNVSGRGCEGALQAGQGEFAHAAPNWRSPAGLQTLWLGRFGGFLLRCVLPCCCWHSMLCQLGARHYCSASSAKQLAQACPPALVTRPLAHRSGHPLTQELGQLVEQLRQQAVLEAEGLPHKGAAAAGGRGHRIHRCSSAARWRPFQSQRVQVK